MIKLLLCSVLVAYVLQTASSECDRGFQCSDFCRSCRKVLKPLRLNSTILPICIDGVCHCFYNPCTKNSSLCDPVPVCQEITSSKAPNAINDGPKSTTESDGSQSNGTMQDIQTTIWGLIAVICICIMIYACCFYLRKKMNTSEAANNQQAGATVEAAPVNNAPPPRYSDIVSSPSANRNVSDSNFSFGSNIMLVRELSRISGDSVELPSYDEALKLSRDRLTDISEGNELASSVAIDKIYNSRTTVQIPLTPPPDVFGNGGNIRAASMPNVHDEEGPSQTFRDSHLAMSLPMLSEDNVQSRTLNSEIS